MVSLRLNPFTLAVLLALVPAGAVAHPLAESLAAREAGDFDEAAALLANEAACGVVAPWCAYFRAEALFYGHRDAEAAAAFAHARALDPSGPVAARAEGREVEALYAAGAIPQAEAAAKALLAKGGGPELRVLYGDCLRARGDVAGANAEYTRVFLQNVEHPASAAAGERLLATGGEKLLTATQLIDRATRAFGVGYPQAALADLERAAQRLRFPEEGARLSLLSGKAHFASGKPDLGLAEVTRAAASTNPAGVRAEASLSLARVALGGADLAAAVAALDKVAADFPDEPAAEEAAFLAAWAHFNRGDYQACASRFDAFATARPRTKRLDEALWYAGFCSLLAGDKPTARARLTSLEAANGRMATQAWYWRARVSEKADAEELYRRIVRREPLSWYGWQARARLEELGLAPEPFPYPSAAAADPKPSGDREQRAAVLASLGLVREAALELDAAGKAARVADEAERIASVGAQLGLFAKSYQLANQKLWPSAFEKHRPASLALLFPRAYEAPVLDAARAVGLEPAFVWAIMRRESRFDATVRSFARAHGLMQMLASTARKVAHLAGQSEVSQAVLDDPSRVLPLSAWYLSELVGRFNSVALAAAAYNAGPTRVAQWSVERAGAPLDEFVERIPLKETRHYVKNVVADFLAYRALYGESGPLPLPQTVSPAAEGATF